MSFTSPFLLIPLIIQFFGTACVLSSPARRRIGVPHDLAPLIISLCLLTSASLLSRGSNGCGPAPGAVYTPALTIGAPLLAIIVLLAPYMKPMRTVRIISVIAIFVALATTLIWLHKFGRIPKVTINPFSCCNPNYDHYLPVLGVLKYAVPLLTIWRDIRAIRYVMTRLSSWFGKRLGA